MAARAAAGLGRFAHPEVLSIGASATVMHGTAPARTSWHAHAGWKVVVAHDDRLGSATPEHAALTGEVLLVPPGVRHRAWSAGPYTAVLLEPGVLRAPDHPRGIAGFERRALGDLAAALASVTGPATDEAAEELRPLIARLAALPGRPLDARVRDVLAHIGQAPSITAAAATVGLSASHLRRLAQEQLGVPLARVRSWERLRRAVLTAGPLSLAAASAGFADQSHLSRTARGLAGRTPADIARSLRGAGTQPQPHG